MSLGWGSVELAARGGNPEEADGWQVWTILSSRLRTSACASDSLRQSPTFAADTGSGSFSKSTFRKRLCLQAYQCRLAKSFSIAAIPNASDGGTRRCILVTNNEVSEKASRRLHKQGHYSGDPEFEAHGIFEQVTRPRVEAVISGRRPDGKVIPGSDKDGRAFGKGLQENVTFYRLSYLDPDRVELGSDFEAVLPLLWLAAGARGVCPSVPRKGSGWLAARDQGLAVLLRESQFARFREAVVAAPEITHIYLVTDSEEAFAEMRSELPRRERIGMLYRDYLRSFRINTERDR